MTNELPPIGATCFVIEETCHDDGLTATTPVTIIAHYMNGDIPIAVYKFGPAGAMYIGSGDYTCYTEGK